MPVLNKKVETSKRAQAKKQVEHAAKARANNLRTKARKAARSEHLAKRKAKIAARPVPVSVAEPVSAAEVSVSV